MSFLKGLGLSRPNILKGINPVTLSEGVGVPSLGNIERLGALGDSITRAMLMQWGSSITRLAFTSKAWAAYASYLSGRKFWFDPAACEGHSGQRSDQILASMLAADATTSFGPAANKVTIPYGVRATGVRRVTTLIGTNDLTFYTGGDPTTFIGYYNDIWDELVAAGITPIVLSLLPRNDAYAADVPDWNDAIEAAAAARGFQFIDIYTPCATGTAWKTGYDWANGVEDATFLHPGADGCLLGIAPAVAAGILSTQTETPHLISASKAELVRGSQTAQIDVLTDTEWDGLFSSVSNWPIYFEGFTSTRTVAAGDIAEFGNYLQVACTPQVSEFYSAFRSQTVNFEVGERYGLLIRSKFDAGHARPTTGDAADQLDISLYDSAISNILLAFASGGVNSYSVEGASLPEGDIYLEFVAPVTAARLLIEQRTQAASSGSTARHAQAAIIGPL